MFEAYLHSCSEIFAEFAEIQFSFLWDKYLCYEFKETKWLVAMKYQWKYLNSMFNSKFNSMLNKYLHV